MGFSPTLLLPGCSSTTASSSTKMSDRKAVIKNADMSEEMQQDAVDCATQALEKYNIEKDRGVHQERVRQEVQPHLALHRGQELWLVRHPRDQAFHLLLPGPGRHPALQERINIHGHLKIE